MSNGLVNLSRLKPEIRLAQAISHFEADLSSDQKASLRTYRMTNFLHAVQQFAAIGDVMIGGSQNLIACGVWSLVRMLLLVSPLYLIYGVLLNTSVVGCNHVFLPRKVIQSPYECWPIGSPLPKHRLTLSPI
jgi:hypothetical protein